MKATKKIISIHVALSLLVSPIALCSTNIVRAVENSGEMASSAHGLVSLKNVDEDELGNIHWKFSINKEATSILSHVELIPKLNAGSILKVLDTNTQKELQSEENDNYVLAEDSIDKETLLLEIVSTKLSNVVDYTMELTPKLISSEGELPLVDQQTVKYSYSAEKVENESTEETVESNTETTTETSSAVESTVEEENSSDSDTTTSEADEVLQDTSESNQVFQRSIRANLGTGNPNVPKGAIKLDEMFSKVGWDRAKGKAITDFTGIIAPGPINQNNGMPYDEITLSGSQRAIGVWSKPKYQLDFNNDFHGRVYVNFGPEDLNGDGEITVDDNADGFAFVMHNDAKADQALTSANQTTDGQNLGVYGGTEAYKPFLESLQLPSFWAIKNSVAVEFDLYSNISGDSIYDKQDNAHRTPHMAWSLPGDNGFTYRSEGNIWGDEKWSGGNKAKIYHKGIQNLNDFVGDNVRDNTWYEFRFDFIKSSGTFSYHLVNPITGAKTPEKIIDWATLNSTNGLNLTKNGNKAYWGFTAANGDASGQTKFVFTQVPVDMDAELHNDVFSAEHSVVDRDNVEEYSPGQPAAIYGNEVTLKSDFVLQADTEAGYYIDTWNTWLNPNLYDLSQDISNVKAVFNGKETEGTASVDEKGNVSVAFKGVNIPKPLTSEAQTLHMSYTAKLKSDGEITKTSFESQVSGREIGNNTPASFRGEDANYWVIPEPQNPTILSWNDPIVETQKIDVTKDRSEVVDGYTDLFYWQDLDKEDKLKFYLKKGTETVFTSPIVTSQGAEGFTEHDFTIPSQYINYGENSFVVEAYRLENNGEVKEVATLDLKITVSGSLVFKTYPENLSWTGRKVSKSKGILDRDAGNGMMLSVLDSREDAEGWELYVQAQITGEKVPFDFVFKNTEGSPTEPVTTDKLLIMQKGDVVANGFYSTKSWGESSGILLESKEYMHVGKDEYSGKVDMVWTLSNTADIQ